MNAVMLAALSASLSSRCCRAAHSLSGSIVACLANDRGHPVDLFSNYFNMLCIMSFLSKS